MSGNILLTYGVGFATLLSSMVEHSPAMPPVGAANLPQESLVTAAGSQSIHIPDSVGRHVNHQMSWDMQLHASSKLLQQSFPDI